MPTLHVDGGVPDAGPAAVPTGAIGRFVRLFKDRAGEVDTAVYLVGSPALGDRSPRQSNLDLVAVTAEPLDADLRRELSSSHRALRLNGRGAAVLYTTWASLEKEPAAAEAAVYLGPEPATSERLANPMTWALLAAHPRALHGAERPSVHSDPAEVRDWFAAQLPGFAARTGQLLWRRQLTRVVLQSTRAAHGALTGEVVSLRRAGELALDGASHTAHRVITDALGYREGANTSMYWGPFERKSNAVTLAHDWLRRLEDAGR